MCGLFRQRLERRLRDDPRARRIWMYLVAGEDLVHLLPQRLLHVDADGLHLRGDFLKVGLHEKRLRTAIEPLALGERRELRPKVQLHLGLGLAVVAQKRDVVVRKLSAPASPRVFLDVFAVVVDAKVADHDVRLPL